MQTAFFLDGQHGRLFCTGFLHPPAQSRRRFLILAPFGEEMNKSRHVLAALVRALGATGDDVLLPDLYGTGDSEGDFGAASIDVWRADIASVIERLGGDAIHLIGLRSGALLAADAADAYDIASLTLIHPVADGRQQLNQLLRLRLASGLTGGAQQESAADLRRMLDDDGSLEIAGYRLSAAMAQGLESLKLADMPVQDVARINWIELVREQDRPLMPVSQRIVETWSAQGRAINTDRVVCDNFWATQEIAQCPAVVDSVYRHVKA